jgi:Xaa-Pro aminopeptidase
MLSIRDGIREHDVAAEGEYAMRRLGSERPGMDTVVASGPNARFIIARKTGRKIRKGDLVSISIGPRCLGYHGELGRPIFYGSRAQKDLDFAMKTACEALKITREALKPGAIGEEVEAAGRNHVKKARLFEYYTYSSCHSVGTAEAEEPVLGTGSGLVVRTNRVFSIDIPLFLAPSGVFGTRTAFSLPNPAA